MPICPNCAYGDYTPDENGEVYLKKCPRCGWSEEEAIAISKKIYGDLYGH